MSGAPDPLYVAARGVLLDAIEALQQHRGAVVLVGAQAVYVHTGDGELDVVPYTTDGDLVLDPQRLTDAPLVNELLSAAGFVRVPEDVGAWRKATAVEGVPRTMVVDLLVPARLAGPGRRAARIPPHDVGAARNRTVKMTTGPPSIVWRQGIIGG